MYELAALLDPDTLHALARATYRGDGARGHHDGRASSTTCITTRAAVGTATRTRWATPSSRPRRDAGLRIVLIDACYLEGGIGRALEGVQLRFGDGSVHAWAERVDALDAGPHAQVGAAIHSVRAVVADGHGGGRPVGGRASAPLHAHVSEQPAENAACIDAYGATPTQLLPRGASALGADSPPCTRSTSTTPTSALLGGSTVLPVPDDRARPRRRHRAERPAA